MNNPNKAEWEKKIAQLKKISIGTIQSCLVPIIDVPIGALDSKKIAQRAVYFLSYNLINIKAATDRLSEIFDKRETDIKALIEKYEEKGNKEVATDLMTLLVTAEDIKKHMESKKDQSSQNEKLPSQDPLVAS